jgi:hypothetical protein
MNRIPLLIAAPFLLLALACGPIGPLAGGRLAGDVQPHPDSWVSIDDIETFQMETRPDDPHSINIWSKSLDGQLYIATSLILGTDVPSERAWVRHVAENPNVRLRAGEQIFELKAVKVGDAAEAARARDALIAKYDVAEDEHSDAAWIYRLEAR